MVEILKEPKPSEEAIKKCHELWCGGASENYAKYLNAAYKIDVEPLIAENERLRISNGQLHADLFGTQDGALLQDLRAYVAELIAENKRLVNERDEARARLAISKDHGHLRNIEAALSGARSRGDDLSRKLEIAEHHNAALVEALRPFAACTSTADDIMQAIRLLAQLDAPQPTEWPVTDDEVNVARVKAELDLANEALTSAYLAGAARGDDSAFEKGRRAGLEEAAKAAEDYPLRDYGQWKGNPGREEIAAAIRALIDHPAADAESEARNG